MMKSRIIGTYTGKRFDFLNPTSDMICVEDIAHALALTNRYSGHTFEPYSVAEHCVRASFLDVGNPLVNLLHDAAEAYIGDIASPQKQCLYFVDGPLDSVETFKSVEKRILRVIGDNLGVRDLSSNIEHPSVKTADLIMLATEVRDLMHSNSKKYFGPWLQGADALPERIKPWSWDKAEDEYLHRFFELKGEIHHANNRT